MSEQTDPIRLGMPAVRGFDAERPPSGELIDDCVHCGFCLPSCPTYVLWGEEMDSPRGRIHLMKTALEGEPLTPEMAGHFDACLGCMACVTACPSGVQYDRLLERTRPQVERNHERTRSERALRAAIFSLFPYPRRLRIARTALRATQRCGLDRAVRRSGVLERLAPHLAAMQRVAPTIGAREPLPELIPAVGERRARVALLTGCVQSEFFPEVNAATARVLAAEGCDVVVPRGQGCCGALSSHSGREPEARGFADATIDTFDPLDVDFVVVNSAGCGSAMKEYEQLLDTGDDTRTARAAAFSERVRDLAEILVELGPRAERHALPTTVAYHDACHLAHAQGVRDQPRELLAGIPDLTVREIADAAICCGSAGVYNILQPEPARALGEQKSRNVIATGAQLLVTANPGCMMQIAAAARDQGTDLAVAHTAQVLDASLRGLSVASLTGVPGDQ
ncbi:heterodisulfide reductase-related iron-sulfur binding cluster [Luteipulveratus sp. YIM 133132]|uniref:(Fe-S)-binding protein n=1 Tax=Luteipulveratus flavus TaxID=3031728 RepID=UPI0023B1BC82|nr:heterodisulfide reductase-related iron-sulfur binding cluster [Luteipulveratus sp. YIM 133132]MDE9367591.1 heterodisulfide reductase-related iron-sulfur binding cluster [Luteipulveratus sp. YIM 133132]